MAPRDAAAPAASTSSKLDEARILHMTALAERMRREETLPTRQDLARDPGLPRHPPHRAHSQAQGGPALRGVRFYEMELLDRYAIEIPTQCRLLLEIHEVGSETIDVLKESAGGSRQEREQNVKDLLYCHGGLSRRWSR